MATKITRVTQKPFGTSGPTGDFGAFGSKAANPASPIFTQSPATIQSLSQFSDGWGEAIIGDYEPALEDMNGLFLLIFYQLGYLFQEGIAEYDSGTEYFVYSICQYNGILYQSLTNSNLGNEPDTNPTRWQCISYIGFGGNVASASSITLPNTGNSFKVTGTTNINNITILPAGAIVELIFTGVLTVATGGNILLNSGAFVTFANATLTLFSDGTSWFELSRNPARPPYGTPVSKSANTPYLAATNGFVYGCINMAGSSGQNGNATFYSSLNSNPTISPTAQIPFVMQVNSTAYDINFPFCFPVAAGEYYEITTGSFTSINTMYFRST